MASYPVTVFRWDDPGAPQLDGTLSALYNVLQKVLVEGYGDKMPLGWTRSYYDAATFKSAWRNNAAAGGSGGSVYFYSTDGADAVGKYARLTGCKSITEAGVITGPNRITAIRTNGGSDGAWFIIGSTIGFYLFIYRKTGDTSLIAPASASYSERYGIYAGDFFSRIPNDAGRFIILQNVLSTGDNSSVSDANGNFSRLSYLNVTSEGVLTLWDADNGGSSRTSYRVSTNNNGSNSGSNDSSGGISYDLNLQQMISPVTIDSNENFGMNTVVDRLNVRRVISTISPTFRGVLPNLYACFYPIGFNQPIPYVYLDNYFVVPTANSSNSTTERGRLSRILIKLGDWYDPFTG